MQPTATESIDSAGIDPSERTDPSRTAVSKTASAYKAGTLTYTRASLFVMMFWMLLAAFCLQIMEQLPSCMVPLQLRWAHASDALIGFITGSLPAILGGLLNPFVGVQSDRHRGRLGRRRPFLLLATPAVVLALIGLGAADPVSCWLVRTFAAQSLEMVKIGWLGGCMTAFVVANTYIMQVYQFMFVDVIPSNVMGQIVGAYRAVGALGVFAFNRWFLGKAESHAAEIYLISAVLYAGSFLLLIWNVKEGEYPLPQAALRDWKGECQGYLKECFGHRFYWTVYSLAFFFWSALVPLWAFLVFFGTKPGGGLIGYAPTVGLSLAAFGKIRAWSALISVPVFIAVGPLADRWHPIRICMVGLALCCAAYAGCFFCVHGEASFQFWLNMMIATQAVYMGGYMALLPKLFPSAKYGQFVSANQIFGFCGVILAPVLCGWLIEVLRDYRFLFAWCGGSTLLCLVLCISLFLQWRGLGGDASYSPPGQERA